MANNRISMSTEPNPLENNDMVHTNITAQESRLLAALALIVGIVFDYLFYGKAIGVSYPLFTVVCYCLFWIALRRQISFQIDFGWFLLVPVFLLSATSAIYSNPVFLILNFILIPLLLLLQTVLLVYKHEWSSGRFLPHFFGCLLRQVVGNSLKVFVEIISPQKIADKIMSEKHKTFRNILIGLTVSAPILLIVITLLASADTVFQNLITDLLKPLEFIGSIPLAERVGAVAIITIVLFGYVAVVLKVKVDGTSESITKDSGSWDAIIIATVLVMVNGVYILFCAIQFTYLFGGEEVIRSIPDFTYAEYARRGFAELIVVTVINLGLLLIGLHFTKNNARLDRLLQGLRCLLVLCTIIILYSAHSRLKLYEAAYGYTYARIFAHTFIGLLFILFLLTLYKLSRQELPLIKAFAIAALLTYTTLNYINVDAIIARKNIDRYFETGKIDLDYLQQLSYDAIPELTRFSTTDNEDTAAKTIAAFLYDKRAELRSKTPWQAYNLSKSKARRMLAEIPQ